MNATATPTPPRWAESFLQLVVRREDFDSVAGDLLEEYRDSVHPAYGAARANRWYVGQVLGFVWRSIALWAALFSAAFVARTALDWLAPPADFSLRSTVTTYLAVGILLCAACATSWRVGSIRAGLFAGLASTAMAALFSLAGVSLLLGIWHDSGTLAAAEASGGVWEAFTLPWMAIVPGAILGTVGGAAGAAVRRLRPA